MKPLLSVIVTVTHDERHIDRCLHSLSRQQGAPDMEIIVPVYPTLENVPRLRSAWPTVRFVELPDAAPSRGQPKHWQYDRRRAAGLCASVGDIVAITEDHAIPARDWCAAILEAHRAPHAVIGGAIEHTGLSRLNRAVYLCDFGRYQPPFAAGPAHFVSDINASYKRWALEKCRPLWNRAYHETAVHGFLRAGGETLWLTPGLLVNYDRGPLALCPILVERFAWARVFAGRRAQDMALARRMLFALLSPGLPFLLAGRRLVSAHRRGRNLWPILDALPVMLLLLFAWSLGEMAGYLTARPFSRPFDPRTLSAATEARDSKVRKEALDPDRTA